MYKKIVQIDSEFLMFRIENSRTVIQQLAYIRKNNLPKDFFSDPESPRVQEAQENILIEMVKGKGKDLLEDLRTRRQDDACIITYDGYIVNGNRRVAALKLLGERYINCAVLPEDTSPKDIYLLEQQLQISEDFREDYHWINELRNIKKGEEDSKLKITEMELVANLRLDPSELKIKLRILDLIDAFLNWKKKPGEYDYPKLDDTEEIFRQLEKATKKYAKEDAKRESLQNAVFTLIEERPSKGRLYGYVMDLIRTFDQVFEQTQAFLQGTNQGTKSNPSSTPDQLDELLNVNRELENPLFDNPETASTDSRNLVDIILDVKEANKEKRDAEAVYLSVRSALRELQGLTIDNDTTKLIGIKNNLEQIINTSQRLLKELNEISSQ